MSKAAAPASANRLLAFPQGLPQEIDCAGLRFELVRTFKHDFFAATGLYAERMTNDHLPDDVPQSRAIEPQAPRRVVLKLQRQRAFLGLPLGWLGAWLTRHEARIYRELADVPGVPRFVGLFGPTGFIHEFVPGHPLARGEKVSDTFFHELAELLSSVHARGLAYVDLNKRQNILVGEDGRPHLIDFQISFRLGRRRGGLPRAILALLQEHDRYHFAKHKRRCRADLMTPAEIEASYRRSGPLNAHRVLSRPYFRIRRWLLDKLHLPRGDEAEG